MEKQANRRQNASSRTKVGAEKAGVFSLGKRYGAELLDSGKGGIGIKVPLSVIGKIMVGSEVEVEFFLCNTFLRDTFRVCSNDGNRIGLMYSDGKNFSPQQRVSEWRRKQSQ